MKLLIFDTSYLIYRSYFAYPLLTSGSQNTGALFGFIKTVMSLIREFQPDNIAFACDLPEKTWRHAIFSGYKAGRPQIEDQMREQLPYILEWCHLITPNVFAKAGYEADDIIFTICLENSPVDQYNTSGVSNITDSSVAQTAATYNNKISEDHEYSIFSADKDLYQMLTVPNVRFVSQHKGVTKLFTQQDFKAKYGLLPQQWVDFKALAGDNSDNLKGLAGIGPKTATKILQETSSLRLLFEILHIPSQIITPAAHNFTAEQRQKVQDFATNPKNARLIAAIQSSQAILEQTYLLATLQSVPGIQIRSQPFNLLNGLTVLERFHLTSLVRSLQSTQQSVATAQTDDNALF